MGKKLITIKNLSEMYNNGKRTLYMNDQVIISPGARDFAHEKGIKVIYGEERPEKHHDLKINIKKLIKETYCVTEEDQINEIVRKVLESLDLQQ